MKGVFRLYSRFSTSRVVASTLPPLTTLDKLLISQGSHQMHSLLSDQSILAHLPTIEVEEGTPELLAQFIGEFTPEYFDTHPFPSLA